MTNYIGLKISVADAVQKDILIAQLSALGAIGFEEDKDLLKVFVKEIDYDATAFKEIIEHNNLKYSISIIEDRNWNAEWEANFTPVLIGSFCAIRASFHPQNTAVQHDIIITPKMSFGTGHHATTHMMVKAMESLDFVHKTVFDFGTGTGVLAILAEKCGAQFITAIDNDEWSINNAMENFNVNDCHSILLYNDNQFPSKVEYDIILANINRNIILQNMREIGQHLAAGGVVLLSGLLTGDEPVIIEEVQKHQLALQCRWEMNGWICLLVVNSQ